MPQDFLKAENGLSLKFFYEGKCFFVLFAILTSKSITGTSVSTPTVVARAAGEIVPNKATATATDSSNKY